MPLPACYDRITWTSDAEGSFKGFRPSFTSFALIKEVLGEWRACRGAFTLSRSALGTVRPSGSPMRSASHLRRPPPAPKERYLDCSFHAVSARDGGISDNLCSNSASLFVWVHFQRLYLSNKSRCVRVIPVLQLDSAWLHSWWINWPVNAKEKTDTGNLFLWICIHAGQLNRRWDSIKAFLHTLRVWWSIQATALS